MFSVKGCNSSIANDDNVRLKFGEVGLEAVESFLGWTEVTSRCAENGITAPAQVAEFQVVSASRKIDRSLKLTIFLSSLDDGVSKENDSIVVFQGDP